MTVLARIIGIECRAMPYTSHIATPSVNTTYMPSDSPRVSRLRIVFAACGTPLVAIHTGTVKAKAFQGSAGNYVVIDAQGVKQDYFYAHLKAPAMVSEGQKVTTGQRLGKVGETGNAQGCHLHFEIWTGGGWYTGGKPIDPLKLLKYWDSFS